MNDNKFNYEKVSQKDLFEKLKKKCEVSSSNDLKDLLKDFIKEDII